MRLVEGEEVLIVSSHKDGTLIYGVNHYIGRVGTVTRLLLDRVQPHYEVRIPGESTWAFHALDLIPINRMNNKSATVFLYED